MKNTFFQSVSSLEELKKQYRKLALIHHPDKGGEEKDFIELKNQYDQLFEQMKKGFNPENNKGFTAYDDINNFKEIIDQLINFDIELEIIGSWIWVSGNTFEAKTTLKENGFKWANKKKAWYYHEGEYKKFSKKHYSLEEIRTMHEHQKVRTNRKAAIGE